MHETTLRIQILTIFPRICESVLRESILKRAQEKGLASLGGRGPPRVDNGQTSNHR